MSPRKNATALKEVSEVVARERVEALLVLAELERQDADESTAAPMPDSMIAMAEVTPPTPPPWLDTDGNLKPGVYHDVPFDEYRKWPALNSSTLKHIHRSPEHLLHEKLRPHEDKEWLTAGQAIHTAVIEPQLYEHQYASAPKLDRRYKENKEKWAEIEKANAGKTVLNEFDFEMYRRIGDKVRAHPELRDLLFCTDTKDVEISVIFKCPYTGILCKMRNDIVVEVCNLIADIKTSRESVTPQEFQRTIFRLSYDLQAAFYRTGWSACGFLYDEYLIIAVEKDPPHGVMLYRLHGEVLDRARDQNIRALELYKACSEKGEWPGYPTAIHDVYLPAYLRNAA